MVDMYSFNLNVKRKPSKKDNKKCIPRVLVIGLIFGILFVGFSTTLCNITDNQYGITPGSDMPTTKEELDHTTRGFNSHEVDYSERLDYGDGNE
jgi:hypothetical protein